MTTQQQHHDHRQQTSEDQSPSSLAMPLPSEHVLFASIDVLERSAPGAAQYSEAKLDETSKAPLFNLSSAEHRRLVISITQADHEAFALESLAVSRQITTNLTLWD